MNDIAADMIPGVILKSITSHSDNRGELFELWSSRDNSDKYLQDTIVKCNKNVLRGMHYQIKEPYAQLITVISGKIFDVLLDLRKNSPTFKRAKSFILSSEDNSQLFMPPGIAHGYVSLTDNVIISYKSSLLYAPGDEGGVLWSSLKGINWPIEKNTIINNRDKNFKSLDMLVGIDFPYIIDSGFDGVINGC